MRYTVIFLLTCSTSLNLFSQEIDLKKIVEDKKKEEKVFDKARTGFILKLGANTFLGKEVPSYLSGKTYSVPSYDSNQSNESVEPGVEEGVMSFDEYVGVTPINYGICYGFNGSIGYKTKLFKSLYLNVDLCYNYTRRSYVYSPNVGGYIAQTYKNRSSKNIHSLSIPISLQFHPGKRLNLELGANVRYTFFKPINGTYQLNYNWVERPSFSDKISLSPFAGFNINLTKGIFICGRYYLGDMVLFSDYFHGGEIEEKSNTGEYEKHTQAQFLPARMVKNQLQFSIGFNLN